MKKIAIIIPVVMLIFSCNYAKETTENGINSALEKAIESQTGEEIDLADVGSFENNKVKGSFLIDGQEKLTGKSNMTGTVLGAKDVNGKMLSFQFQNEEGIMIMVVVSPLPNNFSLPFTTKMYKQNEAPKDASSATVTFIKASENSMFSYMSFDGTLTITDLNAKKVAFTVNGRAGDAMDLDKPENWKDMKADFIITSPIIQTMGFDKNELLK